MCQKLGKMHQKLKMSSVNFVQRDPPSNGRPLFTRPWRALTLIQKTAYCIFSHFYSKIHQIYIFRPRSTSPRLECVLSTLVETVCAVNATILPSATREHAANYKIPSTTNKLFTFMYKTEYFERSMSTP